MVGTDLSSLASGLLCPLPLSSPPPLYPLGELQTTKVRITWGPKEHSVQTWRSNSGMARNCNLPIGGTAKSLL